VESGIPLNLDNPFKNTEDCGFAVSTSSSFTFHPLCAEKTFSDLDNVKNWSLIFASLGNPLA
jgi:hypothetical protein